MNFGKKVVVGVDLQETTPERLRGLRQLEFLKGAEVHLVHVYQSTNVIYGMGEFCQVFPVEEDRRKLQETAVARMVQLSEGVFGSETKVVYRCLFDENPKEEFCLYAKEVKADTIVVFTRERHGIFESTFASYAARHSPCHLLILKP